MTDSIPWHRLQTLAFAGGGNRCWWQAGLLTQLRGHGLALPPQLVGTSAGAAIAAACLTDSIDSALQACRRLYGSNHHLLDRAALRRLTLRFAHDHIYPAWLQSFVHSGNWPELQRAGSELLVAVSRPSRALGLAGSIAAGTLAYLVDKKLRHSIHPRLPRWLGLRQEFLALNAASGAAQARQLLSAAAAAPPFMPSVRLGSGWAFDGGYTDNAPLPAQDAAQRSATLVLLTRHYPGRPAVFRAFGRLYCQPSRPVPVSTWDCTARTSVDAAFELGRQDARQLCESSRIDGAAVA